MTLYSADTKLNLMLRRPLASGMIIGLFLVCSAAIARGQTLAFHAPVVLTVVDENGLPVSEATLQFPSRDAQPFSYKPIMRAAALTRCIGMLRIKFAWRSLASIRPSNLTQTRILEV
jgi:hypothetical protein